MTIYNETVSPIESTTFNTGSGVWHIPLGVSLITNIECSGGGGSGGDGGNNAGGGGGGGGGYSALPNVQVNGGRTDVDYSANESISVNITGIPVPVLITCGSGEDAPSVEYLGYDGTGGEGGGGNGGLYNYSGSSGEDGYSSHGGRGGIGATFGSGDVPEGTYGAAGCEPGGFNFAENGGAGNGGGGGGDASQNEGGSGGSCQLSFTYFRAGLVAGGSAFVHSSKDTSITFDYGTGTWTVPPGIFCIDVELWGGGGGGSGSGGDGGTALGAGGGGGGYCRTESIEVQPGDIINYSIGNGGSGGPTDGLGIGGDGGATTCSTFGMTANGGEGGDTSDTYVPGVGGTGVGGEFNTTGNNAADNADPSDGGSGAYSGGSGGDSGITQLYQNNGYRGEAPGGGGGAGRYHISSHGSGAYGASGRITFTYPVEHHYEESGSGGAVAGGEARSYMVAAVNCGGSAVVNIVTSKTASGGTITSGIAFARIITFKTGSGGMITGGSVNGFSYVGRGGAETGGSCQVKYNIKLHGSGGATTGGSAIFGVNTSRPTSGGAITGGVVFVRRVYRNTTTGGAITGGLCRNSANIKYHVSGGVKVGGSVNQTSIHRNIGHGGVKLFGGAKYSKKAFDLPTILSGVKECIAENSVEPPTQLPDITRNPRQEITGVWCPVEATCQGGLPKIIVTRQKGFVPSAYGTLNPRDRGIAIYAQSNTPETVTSQAIVPTSPHRSDPRSGHIKKIIEGEVVKRYMPNTNKKRM